jgi:hypothetical protein
MQTFLPYYDFWRSAVTLDYKRLGKQRSEGLQILNAMYDDTNSWHEHVAVRMWQGYEDCLRFYLNWIIREWIRRGYKNSLAYSEIPDDFPIPQWLFDERLALSHRCNLMRKDSVYYSQFKWKHIDVDAPYWWPVPLKDAEKQEFMIKYWGE